MFVENIMAQIEFDKAVEMATRYIAGKERVPRYLVKSVVYDDAEESYLSLDDESLELFKAWKHDIEADNFDYTFEEWLNDVRHEEYDPAILGGFEPRRIIDIDLENPKYFVRFTLDFLYCDESGDRTLRSKVVGVNLPDEAYAKLLAWRLHDSHFTFNRLFLVDKEIHENLVYYFESNYAKGKYWYEFQRPYLVEMTEINEDADAILAASQV